MKRIGFASLFEKLSIVIISTSNWYKPPELNWGALIATFFAEIPSRDSKNPPDFSSIFTLSSFDGTSSKTRTPYLLVKVWSNITPPDFFPVTWKVTSFNEKVEPTSNKTKETCLFGFLGSAYSVVDTSSDTSLSPTLIGAEFQIQHHDRMIVMQ